MLTVSCIDICRFPFLLKRPRDIRDPMNTYDGTLALQPSPETNKTPTGNAVKALRASLGSRIQVRPCTNQEVELLFMFGLELVDLPAGMDASKLGLGWVWVEAPGDGDVARHFEYLGLGVLFWMKWRSNRKPGTQVPVLYTGIEES